MTETTVKNNWDGEVQQRTICWGGEEPGCGTPTYAWNSSSINPFRIGAYLLPEEKLRWRTFFQWTNLELPANAIITGITLQVEVENVLNNPNGSVRKCASKPSTLSASAAYALINSSNQYASIAVWGTPVYWQEFTLGGTAVADLQSHLDWFAVGIKDTLESEGTEIKAGLGNVTKFSGANLIVTYYIQATKTFSIDAILVGTIPIIVSPKDAAQETSPVYLRFTTTSLGSTKKHFEIQVDKTDSTFNDLEINPKSIDDQTNWEYWNGASWQPLPVGGLNSAYFGSDARFQVTLTSGNKWWRVREMIRNDG